MALANPLMNTSSLEGIKTIVFDCDGVLIDSYESNMRYYGSIKDALGLAPLTEDEKQFVHSRTHKAAVEYITPEGRLEEAWDFINAFDHAALLPYLKRNDGVREFLAWLRGAGFRLAVNTSRTDTMDFILRFMDMENFFSPVITSTLVKYPKPHPEGLFIILEQHNVSPHETVFVGDSRVDMEAARAAGVRFWAYGDTSMEAEVHIQSFWDIKAAMQRCYKGCMYSD